MQVKKKIGSFLTAVTVSTTLLITPLSAFADDYSKSKTINYVALGDSVVWGQTPTQLGTLPTQGPSYTDYLKDDFVASGFQMNYTKIATSGWKTGDLLTQLQDPINAGAVQNANVITLTIGANDFLTLLQPLIAAYLANPGAPLPQLDPTLINSAATQMATNYGTILSSIRTQNPTANIYVMKYYNGFQATPITDSTLSTTLGLGYCTLNNAIETVTQQVNAATPMLQPIKIVDTTSIITVSNLIPFDVHVNADGHKAIANAFWTAMQVNDREAPVKVSACTTNGKTVLNNGAANHNVKVTLVGKNVVEYKVSLNGKAIKWATTYNKDGIYVVTTKDKLNRVNTFTFTIDKKAPTKPSVNSVYHTSTFVNGKAEKGATIIIQIGKKSYTGKVSAKGVFTVKIPKQKDKTKISVLAKDAAGNVGPATSIKVK